MPWCCGFDSRLCNMKRVFATIAALLAFVLPSYAQLPPLTNIVEYETVLQPGYSSKTEFAICAAAPAGYQFQGYTLVTECKWVGQWTVVNVPFNVVMTDVPAALQGNSTFRSIVLTIHNGSQWPSHAQGTLTAKIQYWYGVPFLVGTKTVALSTTITGGELYFEPLYVNLYW